MGPFFRTLKSGRKIIMAAVLLIFSFGTVLCQTLSPTNQTTIVVESANSASSPASAIHLNEALLDDLKLLKEQMTQKSLQLDSLLGRLSSLENVTSKLLSEKDLLNKQMKTLHTKSSSLEGLIGKLELADVSMLTNLTALLGKVTKLETSLKDVKSTAGKLAASEQRLSTGMRSQNATLRHLNNVNQVWKGNFKIVNTTFSHIRKKVVFPMPNFGTAN